MIALDSVAVSRGGVTVLDDVSLAVEEGEFVALVGPNGAGKTTLLQTVNGVLAPDSGTVTIDGRDVEACDARTVGRLVATVPQGASVGFDFAVEDIVAMGRTPYRRRLGRNDHEADRHHVRRALERTDTAALADRSIDAVSGGERQRVLLARALAQDTPALVLDEPTASLDVNHQVNTLSLVDDLVAEGKTAIAAIHDLGLAARFCDRLVLLADGGVVAEGPPADVLDADALGTAFETEAAVTTDPVTGTPSVTAFGDRADRDVRVHVVGRGPTAARTLARLDDAGVTVTVGVLPDGDVAVETARARGLDAVTAPPFGRVDGPTRDRVADMVAAADVTVLADPPLDADVPSAVPDGQRLVAVGRTEEFPDAAGNAGAPVERLLARATPTEPDDLLGTVLVAADAPKVPADERV